jgi:hypothetical protein
VGDSKQGAPHGVFPGSWGLIWTNSPTLFYAPSEPKVQVAIKNRAMDAVQTRRKPLG